MEEGVSPEDLFEGSISGASGYIPDEDLEKTSLDRLQTFFKAQLIKIISELEGIREVLDLRILIDGQEVKSEEIKLPANSYAVLDTAKSRFILRFGGIVYSPEPKTTDYLYKSMLSKSMLLPGHGNDPTDPVFESEMAVEDILKYESIQNTFPKLRNWGVWTGVQCAPRA